MEEYSKNMEKIFEMMPEGWKEAAETEKALIRGRNIKTPEELLRLNFLYQTHGGTYGLTSSVPILNVSVSLNSGLFLSLLKCAQVPFRGGFLKYPYLKRRPSV